MTVDWDDVGDPCGGTVVDIREAHAIREMNHEPHIDRIVRTTRVAFAWYWRKLSGDRRPVTLGEDVDELCAERLLRYERQPACDSAVAGPKHPKSLAPEKKCIAPTFSTADLPS